ncbi:carboxylating nicotinate-nucleotide diphosphorylase [Candidatus Symbiobacter mobilis]|uniref:Probable nicotinate-nucleotide pyrophosphorylase [carboxylating] n=1 Tax=Candidatus Symbiobacter mobilis CR TaxID=946483 RepID=U5N9I0_9BURK|nr:carboxylating nicotinate-nucleotide diphosphorylase [Candidatus Symbiobacter mobilis]AGX86893.1 nicotinate-nucleotide pyrophosphorylase [Candidatus Symbiobacter mobilis CR]
MDEYFDFSEESVAKLAQADVERSLAEDVGVGDLSACLIEPEQRAHATIRAREAAVICGTPWTQAAFRHFDPSMQIVWHVKEGQACVADQVVLELDGLARAMLSAERTALNFLQLLSAVATKTRDYVRAVAEVQNSRTQVVDTRKTLPGLRLAQKYAVRVGGGINHRLGLYDAILIKENHITAAGGVMQALQKARSVGHKARFVQIEVENIEQLKEALDAGADMILLDNMGLAQMAAAVAINAGRASLEVSGGVTLSGIQAIAAIGVDRISIGSLTKNVRAIDFSMRFVPVSPA